MKAWIHWELFGPYSSQELIYTLHNDNICSSVMVIANNSFTIPGFKDPDFNNRPTRATGSMCHELGHLKT